MTVGDDCAGVAGWTLDLWLLAPHEGLCCVGTVVLKMFAFCFIRFGQLEIIWEIILKFQYHSWTQCGMWLKLISRSACLTNLLYSQLYTIVTTSKGLSAVPLVWRSGLRGKQTITTATTIARHKLSDSDSFSLSGWFATFKKKKHLIQLLTQGICQVVHVTPNLRSRFLSPSQPDRPADCREARQAGLLLSRTVMFLDRDMRSRATLSLGFEHLAHGIRTQCGCVTKQLWHFFYFEACAPLDCIAEMPLRNEWMCQNKWKSSCRLIRDLYLWSGFSQSITE